jgi:hypothetical protein
MLNLCFQKSFSEMRTLQAPPGINVQVSSEAVNMPRAEKKSMLGTYQASEFIMFRQLGQH